MISSCTVLCAGLLFAATGGEWRNIDESAHLGGRKASAGYLRDKVVLVCRWDAKETPTAALARMEEVWGGFKKKSFVLLGSPVLNGADADAAKAAVGKAKVSFPVYADAQPGAGLPRVEKYPAYFVVDETGRRLYSGYDDRMATQALVQGLTDMDAPAGVAQWKRYLDYELKELPAHAYNRLGEFNKANKKEAAAYLAQAKELAKIPSVKDVAKLVAFAKRAKDAPTFGPNERTKRAKYEALVKDILEKCKTLKDVADPRLRQEAKNALADLTWIQATF